MRYTFGESFGSGPKCSKNISFEIELSDEEAAFLRAFLEKNGEGCDYCYLEKENVALFDKINEASSGAVLGRINEDRVAMGERPLDFYEVDWTGINYDFYWPDELIGG